MVISELGPNLSCELRNSKTRTGFPNPDLFDHFAHSGLRLLTPPFAPVLTVRRDTHATFASAESR